MRPVHLRDLIAAALIVAGLLLRVTHLDLIEFKGDERQALDLGIQLLRDRPWTTDALVPTHGLPSSAHIGNAPLFTWLVALFWALTASPVGTTMLVGLINGVSLYPLWRWARRRFDEERSLFVLGITAVSPFAVILSRKLWAQDLLLPGLLCVLWGIEYWRDGRVWRAVVLLGIALLVVGQLHQSGPIALALLPVAFVLQELVGKRRHQPRPVVTRLTVTVAIAVAIVVAVNVFFWWSYAQYLLTVPLQTFLDRARVSGYYPALLEAVIRQVIPLDLFYFFAPDRADFLASGGRRALFVTATTLGVPLALYATWRWLRAPFQIPVLGIWWLLVIAAFTAAQISTYPFYVLILSPLPAVLAGGGFDGHITWPWLRRALQLWRALYVIALLALTISTGLWLADRGGSRGDYGIIFGAQHAQAMVLLSSLDPATPSSDITVFETAAGITCAPPSVEVLWLAHWLDRSHRAIPTTLEVCGGWRALRNERFSYWWTIRQSIQ